MCNGQYQRETQKPHKGSVPLLSSPATHCKQMGRRPQLQDVNPIVILRERGTGEGEEVASQSLLPFLKDLLKPYHH